MKVRNIFVVQPDPDRWSPERPAFTLEPVGPRPLELGGVLDAILTHPDFPLVIAVLVLVAVMVIAILEGGKP